MKCEQPDCECEPTAQTSLTVNGTRVCIDHPACVDWAIARAMKPINGAVASLQRE